MAEQRRQTAEDLQQQVPPPLTVVDAAPQTPNGLYDEIDMQDASGYSLPNFRKSQHGPHDGYESLASPPPPVPGSPGNVYTEEPDFFEPGNGYTPKPDKHIYSR